MSQDTPAFHAILVPLDGSVFAERPSRSALRWRARPPRGFPVAVSDLDERSRENLEEYLQSLADLVRGVDGLSVVTAVPTGRAADEIARSRKTPSCVLHCRLRPLAASWSCRLTARRS